MESPERRVTNLRIQKLLYFIQAKFLKETQTLCFTEDIEAWQFGPVVPAAYEVFKSYGPLDIDIDIFKRLGYVSQRIENEHLISETLDLCSGHSSSELVRITHLQTPWIDAYKKHRGAIITNESMIQYFCGGSIERE